MTPMLEDLQTLSKPFVIKDAAHAVKAYLKTQIELNLIQGLSFTGKDRS